MAKRSHSMRAALAELIQHDAVLGGDRWRPTFRTRAGHVIDGQTIKALSRQALGRTSGPDNSRFTLTAAGRREALALQPRKPA